MGAVKIAVGAAVIAGALVVGFVYGAVSTIVKDTLG